MQPHQGPQTLVNTGFAGIVENVDSVEKNKGNVLKMRKNLHLRVIKAEMQNVDLYKKYPHFEPWIYKEKNVDNVDRLNT